MTIGSTILREYNKSLAFARKPKKKKVRKVRRPSEDYTEEVY